MYRLSSIAYRRPRVQLLGRGGALQLPTCTLIHRPARHHATQSSSSSLIVPELTAPDPSHAKHLSHLRDVDGHLRQSGIVKVHLASPDPNSEYLQLLLDGLHRHQGHQLPISHSAATGWFWDVRPNAINNGPSESDVEMDKTHKARSETMDDFPWHTDCSYEDPPPRFFALQVLQHDRKGGGTLSVMNVSRLSARLSPATRASLSRPEFEIGVPPEFTKDANQKSIVGSVLATGSEGAVMRFRADILTPLTGQAETALRELDGELKRNANASETNPTGETTLHLTSQDMPQGTVLLVDNRRWLHARNHIKDPNRHLRRVRWDAVPFR